MVITSRENQKFKQILSLTKKKGREESLLFIVEGEKFVEEASNYCKVKHIICSETYFKKNKSYIENTIVFADKLFSGLTDTVAAQGILAVCQKPEIVTEDILDLCKREKNSLVLLAEEINDPGNLGSLIRTADAAGVTGILLSKGCTELYSPKVLRSAAGSVFHIPIAEKSCLPHCINELKNIGVTVIAAHLLGSSFPSSIDMGKNSSCALLIGNEAHGLSKEVTGLSDILVKIPMPGKAESLNAAVAGSILLYEAVRQRLI